MHHGSGAPYPFIVCFYLILEVVNDLEVSVVEEDVAVLGHVFAVVKLGNGWEYVREPEQPGHDGVAPAGDVQERLAAGVVLG